MVQLQRPDVAQRDAWLAMADEFEGGHIDGSGLHPRAVDEVRSPEAFAAWVAEIDASERGEGIREGWVPASTRWVVDGDEVVGTIQLRHVLNDFLLREGGHIGYAVRPTARRRGIATRALEMVLDECRERGIDAVLVTCDDDNVGSARTIEANGGVLERSHPDTGRSPGSGKDVLAGRRRYWITLA